MSHHFSGSCPVCGKNNYRMSAVLWPELIDLWQLSEAEVAYINRQQGYRCANCNNNLRSMSLAAAILRESSFHGTLEQFGEAAHALRILEINNAGNLTPYLQRNSLHRLIEYPQFDMQNLDIESNSYDLVIHSDTLEHVQKPERGLSECHRILNPGGICIFSIPVIVDRLTRSRIGLAVSHHGQAGTTDKGQVVYTEFGVDAWTVVIQAGFTSCDIFSLEYPAALTLIARK